MHGNGGEVNSRGLARIVDPPRGIKVWFDSTIELDRIGGRAKHATDSCDCFGSSWYLSGRGTV